MNVHILKLRFEFFLTLLDKFKTFISFEFIKQTYSNILVIIFGVCKSYAYIGNSFIGEQS